MLFCDYCFERFHILEFNNSGYFAQCSDCDGKGSLYYIDGLISPAIIRLFMKGYQPEDWNSGCHRIPYIFFALEHEIFNLLSNMLPPEFILDSPYGQPNGYLAYLCAKIPTGLSNEDEAKWLIKHNSLLLDWVESIPTYNDLVLQEKPVVEVS